VGIPVALEAPRLATGDGALGFWVALSKVFPATRQQRCWVHKTCNVLDKLPKGEQPAAKALLHEVWMAATRADATKAFDRFVEVYGTKWPRATACLEKDRTELLAFYDFPAEHWQHLRTSNPIESTFATVRLTTTPRHLSAGDEAARGGPDIGTRRSPRSQTATGGEDGRGPRELASGHRIKFLPIRPSQPRRTTSESLNH
jgi:transposase-like protein